jgi:hypothetical protein
LQIQAQHSCFQRSESFLECFHKNLCDIGIDPHPYGTHSFTVEGANTLLWCFAGCSETSAHGEAGQRTLTIWALSSSTSSLGPTLHSSNVRIISIRTVLAVTFALHVVARAGARKPFFLQI